MLRSRSEVWASFRELQEALTQWSVHSYACVHGEALESSISFLILHKGMTLRPCAFVAMFPFEFFGVRISDLKRFHWQIMYKLNLRVEDLIYQVVTTE